MKGGEWRALLFPCTAPIAWSKCSSLHLCDVLAVSEVVSHRQFMPILCNILQGSWYYDLLSIQWEHCEQLGVYILTSEYGGGGGHEGVESCKIKHRVRINQCNWNFSIIVLHRKCPPNLWFCILVPYHSRLWRESSWNDCMHSLLPVLIWSHSVPWLSSQPLFSTTEYHFFCVAGALKRARVGHLARKGSWEAE